MFYHHCSYQTYRGYRLWACDGSALQLPDSVENRQIGTHTNQYGEFASAKLIGYFDVLNHLLTRFWIENKRVQELRLIQGRIDQVPSDVIAIYDRIYGSHLLIWLHTHYGSNCLIRLKTTFSNTVIDFLSSGQQELVVTETLAESCWRELRKMGYQKSKYHQITYRLIRVELPSETEVLATTLLDERFTPDDFAELYRLRWGIETCFDYLKNVFKAPIFSGYSPLAVQQDIWSTAIAYNLQTVLLKETESRLAEINKRRRRRYQVNRNVGLTTLKQKIVPLFTVPSKQVEVVGDWLTRRFLRSLERIYDGPSKQRERKMLRGNDRHQTEKNYKPAL